jgi:hypothetical protein
MKDESEMISSLPDQYFEWQGRVITQLELSDRDGIFIDNSENYLHAKALESYTRAALWLFDYSDSYSYKIESKEMRFTDGRIIIECYVYIKTHSMANPSDVFCEKTNIKYTFSIIKTDNKYYIDKVTTTDLFYSISENEIADIVIMNGADLSDKTAVDDAVEQWLKLRADNAFKMQSNYPDIKIPDLEYEMDYEKLNNDLQTLNNVDNVIESEENGDSALSFKSQASVSTAYNSTSAASYADTYALNNNPLFATLTGDCANFVSQCVWAGYISWNGSMSSSTVQSYIANDYKMVTGQSSNNWYMGPNTGHPNWTGLNSFASFLTNTSKIYGPSGTIFNNNKSYTDLPIILLTPGKAIQMKISSTYDHSAFIYSSTGNTLANKLCAAHTSNQKTTVASFAVVYPYIRLLSFNTSVFAN